MYVLKAGDELSPVHVNQARVGEAQMSCIW
jgi:hypothetical protein